MSDAGCVCGGTHGSIKNRRQWSQHLKDVIDGSCVDCMCGIVPKFNKKDEVVDWGYY